ncbi:MAG: hypothetical protein WKF73_18745 [Nocardioidaceae bacterium]
MAQRTMLRAAALLGALSVVVAGCGSGGEDSSAGGDSGGATSGAESSAPDCQPPQAQASGSPRTDPLVVGSLLPETGSLSFSGHPSSPPSTSPSPRSTRPAGCWATR